MPIIHVPAPGDVLMCDFTTGFREPEMVKVRKVVILSPRSRTHFPDTYLVVPLSKTPPCPAGPCHYEFKPRSYFFLDEFESVWAKADMVTCVARHRLERLKINGRFTQVCIRKNDLTQLRLRVLHALGMADLMQPVEKTSTAG